MGNGSGKESGEWTKNIEVHIADAAIWTNTTTRITSKKEAVVGHEMAQFDYASCTELPLKVEKISGTGITVTNAKMTDDEISFTATADNGSYVFSLTDNAYNTITVSGDKVKSVTITKGNGTDTALSLDFPTKTAADVLNHYVRDDALTLMNAGILKGNADGTVRPDDNVTLRELVLLTMRTLGFSDGEAVRRATELDIISEEDAAFLDDAVTREKATDVVYRALTITADEGKLPIDVNEFLTVKNVADDETAVTLDAAYLGFESDVVYGDIHLPKEGPYKSLITWESSDESVIAPNGMVNLPTDGEKTVTLTAKVRRNDAMRQASFTLTAKAASNVLWNAFEGFTDIHKTQTIDGGEKSFSIEATPRDDTVDIVFALASSENVASAYSSFNLKWRFSSSGYIDAHNATAYEAKTAVRYKKDMKYRFDVNVRFKEKKYDITVTDEDGNKSVIAEDYTLSTNAPAATRLDEFYFIATDVNGRDSKAEITYCDLAYVGSRGDYGLDTAEEYWHIQMSDANITQKDDCVYISSDEGVITGDGAWVGAPAENKIVYVLGVPAGDKLFCDYADISDEYFVSAMKARYIGLVNGDESGCFNPRDILSRAECITLVNNLRNTASHYDTMFPR